jgi:hypothetical protein
MSPDMAGETTNASAMAARILMLNPFQVVDGRGGLDGTARTAQALSSVVNDPVRASARPMIGHGASGACASLIIYR